MIASGTEFGVRLVLTLVRLSLEDSWKLHTSATLGSAHPLSLHPYNKRSSD